MAPCSRISCSAGSASVRSRMRRARSSDSPHLALLLVGQRQDPQRQDLVDLGAVEQVARALGRDLRVVVEDDRRRQHACRARRLAHQHRPGADVLAAGGQLARAPRADRAARRTRRRSRRIVCAETSERSSASSRREAPAVVGRRAVEDAARSRGARRRRTGSALTSIAPSSRRCRRVTTSRFRRRRRAARTARSGGRKADARPRGPSAQRPGCRPTRTSRSTASCHGLARSPRTAMRSTRWRNRTVTSSAASGRRLEQALGLQGSIVGVRPARRRHRLRVEHAEVEPLPVLHRRRR